MDNQNPHTILSGSAPEIQSLLFCLGELFAEIRSLKGVVKELLDKEIAKQQQVPLPLVAQTTEQKFWQATGKNPRYRPILEAEIRDALGRFKSLTDAARYLNVSFTTLKRYMIMYHLMEELWKPSRGTTAAAFKARGSVFNHRQSSSGSLSPSASLGP